MYLNAYDTKLGMLVEEQRSKKGSNGLRRIGWNPGTGWGTYDTNAKC